ncbi:hypothetical protein M422DRAFT_26749 [Sphaerobolus stellatus SS14]|nr:hypothetical protein M422DRAFT_26749 [Sphaerobolus stellatus SS14]
MSLKPYQTKLIETTLSIGALKFGSFELKSGRISPYFFISASLSTGSLLETLASAYATHIALKLKDGSFPPFDIIFGPAYKGIPLAASVALLLWRDHGIDVGWSYDRKEAKAHGEGGILVGAPLAEKRVLILDDVITSGKAIRIGMNNIIQGHGKIVGVVICLDREEVTGGVEAPAEGERTSAVEQVSKEIGGPVTALIGMRDLMNWLAGQGREEDLGRMREYWAKYGTGKA